MKRSLRPPTEATHRDTRRPLSVTYNTGNWFFNTYALLNRFRFEFDTTKGHLTDWSINACVVFVVNINH